MSGMPRRALGIVLIIAGPAAVTVGFVNAPTASSCNRIAGLLVLVPWWRRLVED